MKCCEISSNWSGEVYIYSEEARRTISTAAYSAKYDIFTAQTVKPVDALIELERGRVADLDLPCMKIASTELQYELLCHPSTRKIPQLASVDEHSRQLEMIHGIERSISTSWSIHELRLTNACGKYCT